MYVLYVIIHYSFHPVPFSSQHLIVRLNPHNLKVDPFTVKDLTQFIQLAESLNTGLQKTRRNKAGIRVAPAVNISELDTYTSEQIKLAEDIEAQIQNDAFQELTGMSPENLSIKEIRATLEEAYNTEDIQDASKYINNKFEGKRQIIREALKDAFTTYSGIVQSQLDTETDAFTGQDVINNSLDGIFKIGSCSISILVPSSLGVNASTKFVYFVLSTTSS